MQTENLIFLIIFVFAVGFFSYNLSKIIRNISLGKKKNRFDNPVRRSIILLKVAFGQTKILARPVSGILHAIVWWGFLVITVGTLEMAIDGVFGTERVFGFMDVFYRIVTASGDVMAVLILISCVLFLTRRHWVKVKRFSGKEIKKKSSVDATIALVIIIFLMISLLTMNLGYLGLHDHSFVGSYPISNLLLPYIQSWETESIELFHKVSWWSHIMLVLIFLNELPYSKHFHVIMSIPNVYFSNIEELGQMDNMVSVKKEVELMMDPNADPYATPPASAAPPERFGAKDVTDLNWIQLMNAYSCTECGRCTSECPANQTGKLLSPRKIMMDTRDRLKEVGKNIDKHGKDHVDNKSLLYDYIKPEEIWACNTCNACTQACPLNIDPLSIIVDLRRYLVMEESKIPGDLASMLTNIENNGAPWQFSPTDRFNWVNED